MIILTIDLSLSSERATIDKKDKILHWLTVKKKTRKATIKKIRYYKADAKKIARHQQ